LALDERERFTWLYEQAGRELRNRPAWWKNRRRGGKDGLETRRMDFGVARRMATRLRRQRDGQWRQPEQLREFGGLHRSHHREMREDDRLPAAR
jgi:hypothetical protein